MFMGMMLLKLEKIVEQDIKQDNQPFLKKKIKRWKKKTTKSITLEKILLTKEQKLKEYTIQPEKEPQKQLTLETHPSCI